jgi:hypothetical protein
MLLLSYVTLMWATRLLYPSTSTEMMRDGSTDQVGIVAGVVALAMVVNLVVVFFFAVNMGKKGAGYISV